MLKGRAPTPLRGFSATPTPFLELNRGDRRITGSQNTLPRAASGAFVFILNKIFLKKPPVGMGFAYILTGAVGLDRKLIYC
jgi:hypothetical protein